MASPQGMLRTLVVTWAEPASLNAPLVSYVVRYSDFSSVEGNMEMTGGLTVTITGLSPFTSYSITVQACSEVGCGPQSTQITALTGEEGIFQYTPKVMTHTACSILFIWSAVHVYTIAIRMYMRC